MSSLSQFFKNFTLRVSTQEKIIFTRHLAIIIKSGMTLIDALTMLRQQTKSRSLSKILDTVIKDVSNGQFLSASLDKYKSVFGDLFVNIIRVGESSGILSENLEYLSHELKKSRELSKKVTGALVYPGVILSATFGIVGMLIFFIFPKILPVFSSLNIKLPASTKALIFISNAMTNYGGRIALGFLAALIGFWLLLRIKKVQFFYHWLILRLPLVGGMVQSVNMTNFSRTLGLLLKSGVKIVEAVNITAEALPNLVYRQEVKGVAASIQKGESISKHLLTRKHLFPAMAANMVAVGENTGNLSETLLYLGEFYESELDELVKNLSNVMEPVLMLVMGAMVGFVAIAIITPIYEITQAVGRQ
ncbi:MAG: type II secretion system F family protein [bacterium]|nr:type II secretion system F family protein [bacterium]